MPITFADGCKITKFIRFSLSKASRYTVGAIDNLYQKLIFPSVAKYDQYIMYVCVYVCIAVIYDMFNVLK